MGYELSVRRDFVARHFLVGGDWGAENEPHSHHYVVELRLGGDVLNEHGYLVDIVEVERVLDGWVADHRDRLLNDLPAFAGLNPSIEHFCRIAWEGIVPRIRERALLSASVTIWENDIASASYSAPVDGR